ncbi:SpoIIE family protein phosphatase [Leptospira ryugenii]|uniref:SpoIIE family protein phosphatase n=1 Tax=Leptospira ryugenii TaxID=1917863 RepID=UPI000D59C850|nr:SpoIIE family protein phosphatase [Leptospira ryugenii]
MNRNSLFWELTLKLEAFTHTVPVPFAVYYAIITQKMETEKWMIFVGLCIGFATGIGLLGTVLRYFLIKNLFAKIEKIKVPEKGSNIDYTYRDRDYAKSVKLYLFKYPLVEAFIIVIRWFSGVIPIISLYTYIVEYTPSVIRSGFFTLAMIPPISFVTYYFISENSLRPLFTLPQIKNIEIKPDEIPRFDYFKRILISFFSLAALPVSVLSYILYSVSSGEVRVEQPLVPIVIVSSIFIIPLIVCSYVVADTVRQGLNETNRSLNEVAKGNFDIVITPNSGDEFGQQAFVLNDVIQKLREMYAEIIGLNESLEEKVKLRTFELDQSLQELRKLKFQQDGDYYLTYQLLNPLGFQDVQSEKVTVDFFLRQKKQFEFKSNQYDIGGDINIAHSILLKDKKYLLVANADAMGKSMQGAGGALVFGAVFQSLVQRTRINEAFSQLTPNQWLSTSFEEMQRVFEAFDGTMLVSTVIGLLEEETGTLYFLNAEHPYPVLYRDAKACYLEQKNQYFKLGTLGSLPRIEATKIQLNPGDIILLGSDGKDDLLIAMPDGENEINLDDKLFLREVESKGANLSQIFKGLSEVGTIIDDFSLIRLEYMGVTRKQELFSKDGKQLYKEAKRLYHRGKTYDSIRILQNLVEAESNAGPRLKKELAKLFYVYGDLSSAASYGEDYLKVYRDDLEFGYFLSKVYKKVGKLSEALLLAESIRNRAPKKSKYLVHLFHLYVKNAKNERAAAILKDLKIIGLPLEDWEALASLLQ